MPPLPPPLPISRDQVYNHDPRNSSYPNTLQIIRFTIGEQPKIHVQNTKGGTYFDYQNIETYTKFFLL